MILRVKEVKILELSFDSVTFFIKGLKLCLIKIC